LAIADALLKPEIDCIREQKERINIARRCDLGFLAPRADDDAILGVGATVIVSPIQAGHDVVEFLEPRLQPPPNPK
jgi:hypothetical protein